MGEERFCPQCGMDSRVLPVGYDRPPAPPVYQPLPQQPLPAIVPTVPRTTLPRGAMLGLIGGIVGLTVSIIVLMLANVVDNFGGDSTRTYAGAFLTLVLSTVGLLGCFLEGRKMVAGILMWIAAAGLLLSLSWIGWISVTGFALGGTVLIWEARKEAPAARPVTAPPAMPPMVFPPTPMQEKRAPATSRWNGPSAPPAPANQSPSQPSPPVSLQGFATTASVEELRYPKANGVRANEYPPPMREEPRTAEEVLLQDDVYYEPPRKPWTRREWRDNILAALAILGILVAALFAAWFFYIH